ncbi:MAG: glycosyltransferase [bacterium]
MRILMLGWEFPPFISGGLGTACRGLTDAMRRSNTRILFVLPRAIDPAAGTVPNKTPDADPTDNSETSAVEAADSVPIEIEGKRNRPVHPPAWTNDAEAGLRAIAAPSEITNPYGTTSAEVVDTPRTRSTRRSRSVPQVHSSVRVLGVGGEDGYDGDLIRKIFNYADRCVGLTRRELFDVIHAHDWMTFPAAMAIADFSGRPFIVHVHATEFDRSGENVNQDIYEIERRGMQNAAAVIAVSERTKQIVVHRYGVPSEKVTVVYNGIEQNGELKPPRQPPRAEKVVLFLGRITMQKGPEYFVRAAARVAERVSRVKFVIAGTGDQLPRIIELVNSFDLTDRVEFTGFLRGGDVDRAYRNADVYAMPSVSEPFGLTALEAVRHGVPVVLSNSSGVAEVLERGALKVDYDDVESMAGMIAAVLERPALADRLRAESATEIRDLTWDNAARKCICSYYDAVSRAAGGFRSAAVS